MTGQTVHWVRKPVARYREGGPEAMRDGGCSIRGHPRLLGPEDEGALREAHQHPPEKGGFWSDPKVAAWLSRGLGRPVDRGRG